MDSLQCVARQPGETQYELSTVSCVWSVMCGARGGGSVEEREERAPIPGQERVRACHAYVCVCVCVCVTAIKFGMKYWGEEGNLGDIPLPV